MQHDRHHQRGDAPADGAVGDVPSWGDGPAEMYRDCLLGVHRYLVARVGRDLGDELTAQTFVEAWSRRSAYDPEQGTPLAWLIGVAANVLRLHVRQERRRDHAYLTVASQHRDDDLTDTVGEEVCDAVVAADRVRAVRVALDRLESYDREVLLLAAQPGARYQDLADHLNVPVGTVRSQLSRARRRLAAQVEALSRT